MNLLCLCGKSGIINTSVEVHWIMSVFLHLFVPPATDKAGWVQTG